MRDSAIRVAQKTDSAYVRLVHAVTRLWFLPEPPLLADALHGVYQLCPVPRPQVPFVEQRLRGVGCDDNDDRVSRQGLEEVLDEQVILEQTKAQTMEVYHGHGVWLSPTFLGGPALWYPDEILDRSFAIKSHSPERIDHLAQPPVDGVTDCEQNEGSTLGVHGIHGQAHDGDTRIETRSEGRPGTCLEELE